MDIKPLIPLQLDGAIVTTWKKFKQRFQIYLMASKFDQKDEKIQCSSLLHLMGEDLLDIYNNFTFTTEEANKIDPLIGDFEDYFIPKQNVTFKRSVLQSKNT